MGKRTQFIKGQGVRFVSVGVGMFVGVGVVLLLWAVDDDPLPVGVLVSIIAVVLVIGLAATVVGLLIGRSVFGDRVEVALRRTGERKWRHGRLELAPGRLTFTPYRWQMRFVSGDPLDFEVREVGADTGRRPSPTQILTVNPALHLVDVESDQGTLELGVQAHQVDDLRGRLQPTRASS